MKSSVMRIMVSAAAFAAAALGAAHAASPASAPVAAPAAASDACFNSKEWKSWKADGNKRIYLRAGANEVFALDMKHACSQLTWPDARLVTQVRGSTQICSPLDLDLRVSTPPGSSTACSVDTIRKLTTAEAQALPKNVRP